MRSHISGRGGKCGRRSVVIQLDRGAKHPSFRISARLVLAEAHAERGSGALCFNGTALSATHNIALVPSHPLHANILSLPEPRGLLPTLRVLAGVGCLIERFIGFFCYLYCDVVKPALANNWAESRYAMTIHSSEIACSVGRVLGSIAFHEACSFSS